MLAVFELLTRTLLLSANTFFCRLDRKRKPRPVISKRHPLAKTFGANPPDDKDSEPKSPKKSKKLNKESNNKCALPAAVSVPPENVVSGNMATIPCLDDTTCAEPSKQKLEAYLKPPDPKIPGQEIKGKAVSFEEAYHRHLAEKGSYQTPIEEVVKLRRTQKKIMKDDLPSTSSQRQLSLNDTRDLLDLGQGLIPHSSVTNANIYTVTQQQITPSSCNQSSPNENIQEERTAHADPKTLFADKSNETPYTNSDPLSQNNATSHSSSDNVVYTQRKNHDEMIPISDPCINNRTEESSTLDNTSKETSDDIKDEFLEDVKETSSLTPQPVVVVPLHFGIKSSDNNMPHLSPQSSNADIPIDDQNQHEFMPSNLSMEMELETDKADQKLCIKDTCEDADAEETMYITGTKKAESKSDCQDKELLKIENDNPNYAIVNNPLVGLAMAALDGANDDFNDDEPEVKKIKTEDIHTDQKINLGLDSSLNLLAAASSVVASDLPVENDAHLTNRAMQVNDLITEADSLCYQNELPNSSEVDYMNKHHLLSSDLKTVPSTTMSKGGMATSVGQPQFVLQGVAQIHPAIHNIDNVGKETKQVGSSQSSPRSILGTVQTNKPIEEAKFASKQTKSQGKINKQAISPTLDSVVQNKSAPFGVKQSQAVNGTSKKMTVREQLAKLMKEKQCISNDKDVTEIKPLTLQPSVTQANIPSTKVVLQASNLNQAILNAGNLGIGGTQQLMNIGSSIQQQRQPAQQFILSQESITPTTAIMQNVAQGQNVVKTHVQGSHLAVNVNPSTMVQQPVTASMVGTRPAGKPATLLLSGIPHAIQSMNTPQLTALQSGVKNKLILTPQGLIVQPINIQPKVENPNKPIVGQTVAIQNMAALAQQGQFRLVNNQLVATAGGPATIHVQPKLSGMLAEKKPIESIVKNTTNIHCPLTVISSTLTPPSAIYINPAVKATTNMSTTGHSKNEMGVAGNQQISVQAQSLHHQQVLHTTPLQQVNESVRLTSPISLQQTRPSPSSSLIHESRSTPEIQQPVTQDAFLGHAASTTLPEACNVSAESTSETTSDNELPAVGETVVTETVSTSIDIGGEYPSAIDTVSPEQTLYIAEQPDISVDHAYQQAFPESELAKELLKKTKKRSKESCSSDHGDVVKKKVSSITHRSNKTSLVILGHSFNIFYHPAHSGRVIVVMLGFITLHTSIGANPWDSAMATTISAA